MQSLGMLHFLNTTFPGLLYATPRTLENYQNMSTVHMEKTAGNYYFLAHLSCWIQQEPDRNSLEIKGGNQMTQTACRLHPQRSIN
ncbi:hypothetical protein Y1Q_0021830 [Alligator mississippiensis]|uniref:Uncharacterized protein n=1 Tax=Alligator mississippiensis TaxID=8496 RepID=A0A151PB18_ALLMI|nr:hypothetical protein Y1Q_0021830 [Alligator mississippiensis]